MNMPKLIVMIFDALLIVVSALSLWVLRPLPQPKEKQKEEDLTQKTVDDTKKQDNIRSLQNIANNSSEKTADCLNHILTSMAYLEEHGADLERLHSYYLPEMVSILQRCQMLKENGLTDKKTIKDMKDRTISAVTKVVDAMMADAVKKEMSGLKTDIGVIEKTSLHQLGITTKDRK